MHLVLAGFCAVNCWVIPKLWEERHRWRRTPISPRPPKGGIVIRIRPAVIKTDQPMLLAA